MPKDSRKQRLSQILVYSRILPQFLQLIYLWFSQWRKNLLYYYRLVVFLFFLVFIELHFLLLDFVANVLDIMVLPVLDQYIIGNKHKFVV